MKKAEHKRIQQDIKKALKLFGRMAYDKGFIRGLQAAMIVSGAAFIIVIAIISIAR